MPHNTRRKEKLGLSLPFFLCLIWIVLLAILFRWTMLKEEEHTQDLALIQMRSLFGLLVDTRAWNAMQGGVFVPESTASPANPWLAQEDRYVELADGGRLVRVNPAYMTRQIAEISTSAARFRISGKTPKRPQNLSDAWERLALNQYRTLEPALSDPAEVFEITDFEGTPHFRYLVALRAQKDCLRCHNDAKVDQLLGGISLTVPAAPLLGTLDDKARSNMAVFGIIGLVGLGGIGGASWQISRKRLQAEQANNAKTAFLANMSHDMRTPLHGIMGMVEKAEKEGCDKALLGHVRASAGSLLQTVNGILDYSTLGSERHVEQPFSLRACIGACVDAIRPACLARQVALELSTYPHLPDLVLGDNYRLRQAVGNLLGNAAKYTSQGSVRVSLQGKVNGKDLALRITVRDTGPGVPEEARQAIFESFVQGPGVPHDERGSGLGLSIARQVARRMGGDVTLESSPGQGSVFVFTAILPLAGDSMGDQCRENLNDQHTASAFAEADQLPLFDRAAALDALDGKESLMLDLCALFLQEVGQRRQDLDKAVADANWREAINHVHAIKNSAATLSCTRLQQVGALVESSLRRQCPPDFQVWNKLLDETMAALQAGTASTASRGN